MDKTIADTFNAFYSIKWGKQAKDIDFAIMRFLCKAHKDSDLQQIMQDILNAFRPWIDKEEEFSRQDWLDMSDVANELHKKYIFHDNAFPIIAEVYMYIDRRETKKYANGSANH